MPTRRKSPRRSTSPDHVNMTFKFERVKSWIKVQGAGSFLHYFPFPAALKGIPDPGAVPSLLYTTDGKEISFRRLEKINGVSVNRPGLASRMMNNPEAVAKEERTFDIEVSQTSRDALNRILKSETKVFRAKHFTDANIREILKRGIE